MVELTLDRIVNLAGDWTDGSHASQEFRTILEDEQTPTEDVESYLQEAIQGGETHHNRALQDIVNNLGQRLGFQVEYGVYQGTAETIGFDGHWISTAAETETHLVVETKTSTTYAIDPGQAGGYMKTLVNENEIDREQVYGLYVIGEGDVETVAKTVLGSQYRDRMRVITAQRLLNLLKIQQESGLLHEQVVDVLLPINTVDVGQLVELIQDVIEFRETDDEDVTGAGRTGSTSGGRHETDWDGPRTGANAVQGQIARAELEGPDDAMVAVFPSQRSGIEFLKENNAWGFVHIDREPDYVAMYISEDVQEIRYVAEVREIVPATEAHLARTLDSYVGEQADFDESKQVVRFEPGSLYELVDPIKYESRVPYSLRYTDLGRFKTADTTDDIL